ncbi:MAG: glycosyltransferase family 39 protein [Anaerolineae bacterium]
MGKQSRLRRQHKQPLGRQAVSSYPIFLLKFNITELLARFGLWGVLLIFLILAVWYSLIVPITQGEDELAHYRYLSFIAQKGRLPIDYTERKQAWYRADWPPLYHLIVGWAVSPLDTTQPHLKDVGESPRRRLVGEIFYPRLIIYTEDASWPWQDGILAWHIGRFISILFSAAALVFVHLSTVEMCRGVFTNLWHVPSDEKPLPHRWRDSPLSGGEGLGVRAIYEGEVYSAPLPPRSSAPALRAFGVLALAVTALLAFTPRYLFTSAMLGDDSLFILLSAAFIWLLLRAIRGSEQWWLYALMGLLLGLSITTKYSTGLLPLAVIPVALWRVKQAAWSWRKAVGRITLTWLFTLLGSSWWFGWIIYYFNTTKTDGLLLGSLKPLLASGPDVSMRRVFALFGGAAFTGSARPGAVAAGSFGEWWAYLFQTFWGVPVLEHDPLFPWAYLALLLLCLAALAGLWRLWRVTEAEGRMVLATLALIVILLFPFPILRFFLTHNILETGQGRHILYPAAQAIPILLVLGWATLIGQVKKRGDLFYPFAFILLPSLLLLLWSLFQLGYMISTYPVPLPVRTTTFNEASIPQPLKHDFGEAIQLLGYDFVPDPTQAIVNLTLFWRARQPVDENFRTQVQLLDSAGRPHFTWLSHPLNGRYPTRAWDKGDVIRDTLPLPLAAVPADTYNLQLTLLHEVEDTPLTPEPFQFIFVPLGKQQPIAGASTLAGQFEYRLWLNAQPVRARQTLALSWTYVSSPTNHSPLSNPQSSPKPTWALLGPDDIPRLPVATGDATAIFIVGLDWPSGPYRLNLSASKDSYQTEPLLTVATEARRFTLPSVQTEPGYVPVEANFAEQIKLLGYVLPTRRVEPGGSLPLTLYWQSLAPVGGDYLTFATLLDSQQQPYGQVDRYPSGFYSPMLWAENEVVPDSFSVPVKSAAPAGVYFLRVGQYQLANGQPQSLKLVQEGQPTGASAVVIGPIKVAGPPPGVTGQNPSPQVKLNLTLGNQVTLLGYDLDEPSIDNCQSTIDNCQLSITLYWRAETIPSTDYTTFLHLRDATNQTVAQQDSPPAAGRYPTSLWEAGEIIVDQITLPLAGVAPGRYTPVVGLYDAQTGLRLAVPGAPANEVALLPIELKD